MLLPPNILSVILFPESSIANNQQSCEPISSIVESGQGLGFVLPYTRKPPHADAAITIKPQTAVAITDTTANEDATVTTTSGHNTFFQKLGTRLFPHHPVGGRRDAKLALTFTLCGLVFSPLGIAALAFGIRALRAHTRDRDIAIASIILGSIEIVIMIFLTLYFLVRGPALYLYL